MRKHLKSIILSLLMLVLSFSVATNSLNGEVETPTFEETAEPLNVILPITNLNIPGFQEGSIFTDTTLSSGGFHTCAILDNGSVACWGRGDSGQLGNGGTSNTNTPTLINSFGLGRTAISVSSGGAHTCAILDNGSVACWGRGDLGQLGNGDTSNKNSPTLTSSLGVGRTAVAISSGPSHTCAILDNGLVSCWGGGQYGRLGNGVTSNQNTPTQTSGLGVGRTAVAISSGNYNTCVILDNGLVSCWGGGQVGQLGNGNASDSSIPVLTSSLGTGRTAVAISTGYRHVCAILDDGLVSCWGRGANGQLGNGGTSDQYSPTLTSNLGTGRTAVALSSGSSHTCAILDNDSISCWGFGAEGQLGNGGTSDQYSPTLTSNLGTGRTAVALSSDASHTCAILDNGSVSCWGKNSYGRLGNGGTSNNNSPTLTSSLGTGRTVALSERDFDNNGVLNIFQGHTPIVDIRESTISTGNGYTCVILDNGSVSCWGDGSFSTLGNGGTSYQYSPSLTGSLGTGRKAVSIEAGSYHACSILDDGTISCWGSNGVGQLGDGTSNTRNLPTQTTPLAAGRTATDLALGQGHSCALLDNGSVLCWGDNNLGYLGIGSFGGYQYSMSAVNFGIGRTAVAISAGNYHTCAILDNGSVSCWGSNLNGQLGNGGYSNANVPTLTSSLGSGRSAVAISSGSSHTCAILDNGSVSCWGWNVNGQLGNGGNLNSTVPTLTSSLGQGRTAKAVTTGSSWTCAILDNGSLSCWGLGSMSGQGVSGNRHTPALAGSFEDGRTVYAISGGSSQNMCAILDNGLVSCWGSNYRGALGRGTSGGANYTSGQTDSLGPGRSALLIDGDMDGDGVLDTEDDYPNNSRRTTSCTAGQYGRYVCVDSPAGKYSINGSIYAIDASPGFYVDASLGPGQTSQTACSLGTYNPNSGSINSTTCIDASIGHYVDLTGQSSQTACSVGTYQASTGQSSCIDASAGHYVGQIGQSSQTTCSIGTYQTSTGQSSCNNASAGHYVDASLGPGQTSQTACSLGTYNPNTGSTSPSACINASAGFYVDLIGQSSQIACPVGSYNPNSGSTSPSACIDAASGHYVGQTGQSSQTPCSVGTYQSATGQSSCDDASPGYYVDISLGTGQTSQTACSVGSYNPNTGSTSSSACIDASFGHYVDASLGTGQSSQTPCSIGTYNPNTGSTSPSACIDASAGYYVGQTGQAIQIGCSKGTYQATTGQSSCDDADPGHYVPTTAQSSQTACSIGTYNPNTGSTSLSACIDASAGYYVDQTGQSSQIPCFSGTYQSATGQSSCDDADPGHYVEASLGTGQTSQIACLEGTYNPNTGSTSSSACIDASFGYYVGQTGQASQTACSPGTYNPNTGSTSPAACIDASSGHYVDASLGTGQASQTACNVGTYNPNTGSTSQTDCIDASAGHYVNLTGQSSQTPCASGTYQAETGQLSCDIASRGHYVHLPGQSKQTPCPSGTYNPSTESKSSTACIDASVGHYVDALFGTGQIDQTACLTGTYNPTTGSTSPAACVDASSGHYVDASLGTGQSTQTACLRGTYNPNLGSTNPSACIDASLGHYVDLTGQSSQTACSVGTYQASTGQSSCIDASPGFYVEQIGQSSQIACEVGEYQPTTGASGCFPARYGYYVPITGQSNQTICPIGTYQPITGQSSCIDASAGFYVGQIGQTSQDACPTGTYNPKNKSTNISDCIDADTGYYVDQSGQSNQTPCSTGSFNPYTGGSNPNCVLAYRGFYVPTVGQSNQTICDVGTYQSSTGSSICDNAEVGYYVDFVGSSYQIQCDELKSTIDHSSKNETDCLPDLDSDLVPDIIDDDDDGDGINDSEDKFKDDPTEWYDFDLDGIGDNQDIDDDNDGWSDAEELRAGSDPYSNLDQPVEGFEVIVPGTSISLGAWDLIGIFGGLPLFIWVSFGFITRNNRSLRFEEKIRNTKSHSELLTITKQVELCLTLRLLGVNQGIQLDKVRTEVEENLKHVKDEIGQKAEKNVPEISNSSLQLTQTVPSTSESGVIGDDGYEWINFPPNSQTNFYRAPGDKEWILWEH